MDSATQEKKYDQASGRDLHAAYSSESSSSVGAAGLDASEGCRTAYLAVFPANTDRVFLVSSEMEPYVPGSPHAASVKRNTIASVDLCMLLLFQGEPWQYSRTMCP